MDRETQFLAARFFSHTSPKIPPVSTAQPVSTRVTTARYGSLASIEGFPFLSHRRGKPVESVVAAAANGNLSRQMF